MQPENSFQLAETSSGGVQEEDYPASDAGLCSLDEISALLTGNNRTALKKVREKLWENLEESQQLLGECSDKIRDELPGSSARESLFLTKEHTGIVLKQAEIFDMLAMISSISQAGVKRITDQPNAERSVNRSSRRTKPPIIVDGELT